MSSSGHGSAAISGALAAAICMAIAQIVFLAKGFGPGDALAYGTSLSCIAFGGTYVGVFLITRLRRGKRAAVPGAMPATDPGTARL
jgi:hypothetical protein